VIWEVYTTELRGSFLAVVAE